MDNTLRDLINEFTENLIEVDEIQVPITLDSLKEYIEKNKGELMEVDIIDGFADGKIEKINNTFRITISSNQSNNRKKFSIAHELGHLYLHMGFRFNKILWDKIATDTFYRSNSSELEYQAHEFAASFLMPRNIFIDVMRKNYNNDGSYNMQNVAEFFGVSLEAAINRGKWLNLLLW